MAEIDIEELAKLGREKKLEYLQSILKNDDDFFKKVVLLMAMQESEAEKVLMIISEYRAKEWKLMKMLKDGVEIDENDFLISELEEKDSSVPKIEKQEISQIEKIEEVQKEMESMNLVPKPKESSFLKLLNKIKARFGK